MAASPKSAKRMLSKSTAPLTRHPQNVSHGARYTGLVNAASKPAAAESRTRILAIDYGRRRIGIAVADSAVGIAEPLATLQRVNRNEDMRRLRELAREHRVKQILVGLPLRLDGTRGEMAEEAERFAQRVRKQIGIPVQLVDERLSSWEAERKMEEEFGKQLRSLSRKKGESKISVDSIAAVVILREFLSAHQPAAEDI